jgi:uncharacterized NAD(P)/FAD-binding protein YdhS
MCSRKIAIIGAGFSGTALAAALHRYAHHPLEIHLFEKTGQFGAGDAYRTPFSYHLLNARANDMSALEDDARHFVDWLQQHAATKLDIDQPIARQFVPRVLYHQYLQTLLKNIYGDVRLHLIPEEVVDLELVGSKVMLTLKNQQSMLVDKVVLALGNNPPSKLPFPVSADINSIENPWNYTALNNIPADQPVMIIGTGLSMVDAILTLRHQQHRGKITAVSRHGLLPLPHSEHCAPVAMGVETLPRNVPDMMKVVRSAARELMRQGGDWRGIINAVRPQLGDIWQRSSEYDKKQFLRHVLPYWNIHRHRVHQKLHDLLTTMRNDGGLEVLAGRIKSASGGEVRVQLRQSHRECSLPVKHIINCMGSSFQPAEQPLLQALLQRQLIQFDALRLGIDATAACELKMPTGEISSSCYVLGPPMRGEVWECIAVPEIRKQCKLLARALLNVA